MWACAVRMSVRIVLMAAIAMAVFTFWPVQTGRGFLPSHRRTVWVEATQQANAAWAFSVIGEGDGGDADPPPPTSAGVVRIRVFETSMGRTNPGYNQWRATHWMVLSVADADRGWRWFDDPEDLPAGGVMDAITDYIEVQLIPDSPALAIWPDTPPDNVEMNGELAWIAWQHKPHHISRVSTIVVSLLIGAVASFIVLPVRRHDRSAIEEEEPSPLAPLPAGQGDQTNA